MDFVTRLKYLKVLGCEKVIGASNMVMNSLTYDMNMFKTLETLEVRGRWREGGEEGWRGGRSQ